MKKLTRTLSAVVMAFLPLTAAAQSEPDDEFYDFLRHVRDCYREVSEMPSETYEQDGDRFEKSLGCDDGAEVYTYNHVYRQAQQIRYAVFEVERAVEVLKDMEPYAKDLEALDEVTKELRKASDTLFWIGYLN